MWSDFDINMEKQSNGDVKIVYNEDAIKNSLINIFSTMKGDRRMIPDAFIELHRILFEPMDQNTASLIGVELVSAIQKWDNRITVINFNVDINEDKNMYVTRLSYKLKTSENVEQLDYIFRTI